MRMSNLTFSESGQIIIKIIIANKFHDAVFLNVVVAELDNKFLSF